MGHAPQLELWPSARRLPAPPRPEPAVSPAVTDGSKGDDAHALLVRLQRLGLRGIESLRLTRNRTVMVSFRGDALSVHAAYVHAPDAVLRAVVTFVCGRGAARRAAKRALLAFPVTSLGGRRRRERAHADDGALVERLRAAHRELNASRFSSTLRDIEVRVSRRMRRRLGHYAPGSERESLGSEIVISRRHIRRDGWRQALETLLHEMVHQWQHETGHPLDHGAAFRRKAIEVGIAPRASRAPD
jgi:hypothetical protein